MSKISFSVLRCNRIGRTWRSDSPLPFAEGIKSSAQIDTIAVGLTTEAKHAEDWRAPPHEHKSYLATPDTEHGDVRRGPGYNEVVNDGHPIFAAVVSPLGQLKKRWRNIPREIHCAQGK